MKNILNCLSQDRHYVAYERHDDPQSGQLRFAGWEPVVFFAVTGLISAIPILLVAAISHR